MACGGLFILIFLHSQLFFFKCNYIISFRKLWIINYFNITKIQPFLIHFVKSPPACPLCKIPTLWAVSPCSFCKILALRAALAARGGAVKHLFTVQFSQGKKLIFIAKSENITDNIITFSSIKGGSAYSRGLIWGSFIWGAFYSNKQIYLKCMHAFLVVLKAIVVVDNCIIGLQGRNNNS